MASLTRNDVQVIVEQARNRLVDYMPSRQDMQSVQDTVKNLITLLNQNQNLLRQAENQYIQLVRRSNALEARFLLLEREIQQLRRSVIQVADHQPQRITERVIVNAQGEQPYVYTPAWYEFRTGLPAIPREEIVLSTQVQSS